MDGTENKKEKITSFVDIELTINDRPMKIQAHITGLGKQKIILGFPWLTKHNANINWKTGKFAWRTKRPFKIKQHPITPLHRAKLATLQPTIIEETDQEEHLNHSQNPSSNEILLAYIKEEQKPNEVCINIKTSNAIEFHLQHNEKKDDIPLEQQIPEAYHTYLNVFNERKADRFPKQQPWDHKIELKDGFQPKSFKTYNLTPEEQKDLDSWTKENLDKGYIRPSQSPMASPFFYIKKKDGKLRQCQDYRYLNDWTIKNAYPLPLISELTDKLAGARYFTKLNV